MIKKSNIGRYCTVRLVDTFMPAVALTNGGNFVVTIHFGQNMDIVVVTAEKKVLSKDDQERIRILTDVKH